MADDAESSSEDQTDAPGEDTPLPNEDATVPTTLTGALQAGDANAALDAMMSADENQNSVDSILNTPAPGGFDINAHLAGYDAAQAAAVNGAGVAGGSEETAKGLRINHDSGFYDSSGFHSADASGNITGENNPAYGTMAARMDPNASGSLVRSELERDGTNTTGKRLFDFSGTNSQGDTIWQQKQPAPRQDLRFQNFPKAPLAPTPFAPVKPTAGVGSVLSPKKSIDDLQAELDAAARPEKRKRNLFPSFPAS
jgi:hypothetical protein